VARFDCVTPLPVLQKGGAKRKVKQEEGTCRNVREKGDKSKISIGPQKQLRR